MTRDRYGRRYWCVKTALSPDGEIYLFADAVEIREGCLIFVRGDDREVNLTLAPGQWSACFAASCIDGSAIAVEHWTGEVLR